MFRRFPGIPINKYIFITRLLEGKKVGAQYLLRRRECLLLPFYPLFYLWGVFLYWRVKKQERGRLKQAQYQYNLAVVAIAKNESPYIAEWLAYHKLQGVEVVFLYDNDSTDNMREVLEPFIADGFVIYNEIHGAKKQYDAYNDAINRFGHLCKYMAFIDCDEFLTPMNVGDRLLNLIDSVFEKDENIGGLVVNWCIYGSSGHEKKPEGLVIENYTSHAQVDFEWNEYIKSIVKPSSVQFFAHAHYPVYKRGFYPVNYQGKFNALCWNVISEFEGLKINHYICKSKEEFVIRRRFASADNGLYRPIDDFYINDRNEVKDTVILKYVNDVKRLMSNFVQ